MCVGNWRSHILVKCKTCKKLMGYYKIAEDVQCVDCERKISGDYNG